MLAVNKLPETARILPFYTTEYIREDIRRTPSPRIDQGIIKVFLILKYILK